MALLTADSSVTSVRTKVASPPARRIPSAAASPSVLRRPASTTRAPARAHSSAVTLPIPEVAPETNTTLPSSRGMRFSRGLWQPAGSIYMIVKSCANVQLACALSKGFPRVAAMSKYRAVAKFRIHPGKGAEFREVAAQCLEAVKAREPGTTVYEWFINEASTECVVLETYESAAALLA